VTLHMAADVLRRDSHLILASYLGEHTEAV
jgi:hypothetical protein